MGQGADDEGLEVRSVTCPCIEWTGAVSEVLWLETGDDCRCPVCLCVHVYASEHWRDHKISIGHGCLSGDPKVRVPLSSLARHLSIS